MMIWHVQLMNLSTCQSRVEVGRFKFFVPIKINSKVPFASESQWLLWRVFPRESLWNSCYTSGKTVVIRNTERSWGHDIVMRYFLWPIECSSEWKVDPLWHINLIFPQDRSGKGRQILLLCSLPVWIWVFTMCEQYSLFTWLEGQNVCSVPSGNFGNVAWLMMWFVSGAEFGEEFF